MTGTEVMSVGPFIAPSIAPFTLRATESVTWFPSVGRGPSGSGLLFMTLSRVRKDGVEDEGDSVRDRRRGKFEATLMRRQRLGRFESVKVEGGGD